MAAVYVELNLQPLVALPSSGKLVLCNGDFRGLEALLHPTNLELFHARVVSSDACICASKLEKLRKSDSQLMLQGQGLAACQNLRDLHLSQCWVDA